MGIVKEAYQSLPKGNCIVISSAEQVDQYGFVLGFLDKEGEVENEEID